MFMGYFPRGFNPLVSHDDVSVLYLFIGNWKMFPKLNHNWSSRRLTWKLQLETYSMLTDSNNFVCVCVCVRVRVHVCVCYNEIGFVHLVIYINMN